MNSQLDYVSALQCKIIREFKFPKMRAGSFWNEAVPLLTAQHPDGGAVLEKIRL